MRTKLLVMGFAIVALCAVPAAAQRAPTAQVTTVRNEPDRVFFLAGALPTQRPVRPVDIWAWTLFKTPRPGGTDSLAVHYRFDCAQGQIGTLFAETYGSNRLLEGQATPVMMASPRAGTINAALLEMVCNPAAHPRPERFATLAQAWQALLQRVPAR